MMGDTPRVMGGDVGIILCKGEYRMGLGMMGSDGG